MLIELGVEKKRLKIFSQFNNQTASKRVEEFSWNVVIEYERQTKILLIISRQ